jgi:hypothetical protein
MNLCRRRRVPYHTPYPARAAPAPSPGVTVKAVHVIARTAPSTLTFDVLGTETRACQLEVLFLTTGRPARGTGSEPMLNQCVYVAFRARHDPSPDQVDWSHDIDMTLYVIRDVRKHNHYAYRLSQHVTPTCDDLRPRERSQIDPACRCVAAAPPPGRRVSGAGGRVADSWPMAMHLSVTVSPGRASTRRGRAR